MEKEEEKEKEIKSLGDKMASHSIEQAEELRDYIMKEHDLVMGIVESVVCVKCGERDNTPWTGSYRSDEFDYWFRGGATA